MSRELNRRRFLREGMLIGVGAGLGAAVSTWSREASSGRAFAQDGPRNSQFEERLRELQIELADPAPPVAVYVPAVITGNLLFTAGHIPRTPGGELITGRVGADLTAEEAADAARLTGLQILSTVRSTLGTLDRVAQLVKVVGMVNCTPEFTKQSQVINGFSELMIQIFGERAGKAARSAVGMSSLPLNVPVEIEAIFEILPPSA